MQMTFLDMNKHGSALQAVKPLASKPALSLSYHILGASAWPYRLLLSFRTWSGGKPGTLGGREI
eukprot:13440910-Ditylum_brightwellii.AAC.1